jgi:hypothetical protein
MDRPGAIFSVTIRLVQGPSGLTAPTPTEVQRALICGLITGFHQDVEALDLLQTNPGRIAYQGADIGNRLERAMWLSLASVDVKEAAGNGGCP